MANLRRFLFYAMAVCLSTQASAQLFQIPPTPSQSSVVATPATINGDGVPDLIVGTGVGGGLVNIFSGVDGAAIVGGPPFGPGFTGGVRVAAADFTGDGIAEVVAGSGPGAAEVRVFDGATAAMLASFSPFGASTGGVYVAAGDINGDGHPDLVVGGGEGVAQAISFDGSTHSPLASGYPFGFGYTGGVTVALGDVNGDGRLDYITGMAAGGLVSVFDGVTLLPLAIGFPYGPTYTGGVYVAAGDITGDGRAEVVTGQRNAPSATVSVFDVENQSLLASVVPHPGASGVTVAVGDVNGDGFGDLLTGAGPGVAPQIRLFSGATHTELLNLLAFPASFHGGVFVATTASQGLRFTSADATAFTTGVADTFTITTAGGINPPIVITSGTLPSGVTFTDNGDGTATLAGPPEAGTAGIYPLTFQAGTTVTETQNFTLTVQEPPAITSVDATTFLLDTPGTFVVTTTGFPTPELTQTGALPAGVTFVDNGDGTATLGGTPESAGVFPLTLTATNPAGTANQTFTLTVDDVPVANADSYTVNEGGTLTVPAGGIMANDTNVVGTLTATLIAGPAHATSFTFSSDGSFSYTHDGSETPLTDTFTYQINDGAQDSNLATVTITITPQNDAPVATNDAYSVAEGGTVSPAAPGVLANDTDVDTAPGALTAVLVTGPTQATSFTLNADGSFSYLHNGSETVTDSFTYRASDGTLQSNIATVTITITPVADGPTAVNDTYGVAEGGTLTVPVPGVLGNDQNPEGNPLTAVLVSGPTHATTFILNADGSFTYTHNGAEAPTDTFTYHAHAGGLDSNVATVTITIANVNDPPTALPDSYNVSEGGTLTAPAPGVLGNDLDPDSVLTASLVSGPAHASAFSLNPDGSFSYTHDGSETPLTDSFTYAASDGIAPPSVGTVTITITPVSEPPALDLDADDSSGATGADYQVTFTEGDPPTFIQDATDATITDADSPTLSSITVTLTNLLDPTFEVLDVDLVTGGFNANFTKAYDPTTDPTKGVLTITATTPQPTADFVTLLRRVTYENTDTAPDLTSRIIEFVVNDGTGNSNTATTTVTLVEANSPPTADDDNYNVAEGGTLTVPAPGVLDGDEDADSPGATLTAALVTGPANASSFTLNSDGSFSYTHNGSETTTDSFTYTATSSAGGTSASATVTITINAVNDAPALTGVELTALTFTEGNATTVISNTITVTDPDDTNLESATVQIAVNYASGQDVLGFVNQNGITGVFDALTGVLTLTGTSSVTNYQTALRSVTYFNGSNNPSQLTRTVSWTVNDGTANSNTVFRTIEVVAVNDPPIVANETFELLGNTELRVDMTAGTTPHTSETTTGVSAVKGVLDNDGDLEGDPIAVTGILNCTVPDTTPPFDCTLTGGAVVHVEASGEFSYTPAPGATSGSFTYTVTDTPAQGLASSTNGNVTFTFFDMIWYVDADVPAGGNGTSLAPFNMFTAGTLAGAGGAGDLDDADDYIFVHAAAAAISAGIPLEIGQHLIGEAAGLSIPRNLNGNGTPTVLVPPGSRPAIANAAGNVVAITNAIPIEVIGLALSGSVNAIDLTSAAALPASATLTIANNVINSAGAEGIDINLNTGTTGTLALTIDGNTWNVANTHSGNAVEITRAGTSTLNLNFSNNTNIKSTGTAVMIDGGAVANANITGFANNSIHQSTVGAGVTIANATFDANPATGGVQQVNAGTLPIGVSGDPVGGAGLTLTNVQGNLSFTDLDVFAGTSALTATGTGTGLTLAVAPLVSTLVAQNGAAVNLTLAAITLQVGSLTSTTSASGVSLTTVSGTFSAPSGSTITKSSGTGAAFSVNNSAAGTTVLSATYGGTINNTSGTGGSVAITTADAGSSLSFTGAITDNPGTGIALATNTGATMSFSGGLTLNGANSRFAATGGGTLNVTGTNTIGATTPPTGPALNVGSTTIGASHVTFRTISANGGTNGIVLDTTGSSGSLRVQGTGSTGSGGEIQLTAGAGISLTNTLHPQFAWMNIHDIGHSGVDGQQVTDFTIDNSTINNVGTAAAGQHNESNIAFNDGGVFTSSSLSGTVTITNNTLTNARRHGIQIENGTGTIANLTISNNVLTSSTSAAVSLGNAIVVLAQGSATLNAHVTTGTIAGNTISNFPSGEGILIAGGAANVSNNTSSTLGANGTPITITGNAISGQAAAAQHLGSNAIRASFNGQVGVANFSITNNGTAGSPITNIQGQGISVFMGGTVTGTTTINNNFIVANQTLAAGTQGLAVQIDDGPAGLGTSAADYNVVITNNNVSAYEGNGIRAIARASLGKMDVTIQNNTVGTPILTNRNGIRIDSGSAVGDVTVCLAISGNTSDGSGVNAGIGLRKQGSVAATNDFGIVGLSPSPTTAANAEARVETDNPAGGGTDIISGNNFTSCTITP